MKQKVKNVVRLIKSLMLATFWGLLKFRVRGRTEGS